MRGKRRIILRLSRAVVSAIALVGYQRRPSEIGTRRVLRLARDRHRHATARRITARWKQLAASGGRAECRRQRRAQFTPFQMREEEVRSGSRSEW